MSKTVIIKRKALFGDCDPAGIVYTPRFTHFVLEAVHDALALWLNGQGIKALLAHKLILPVRALALDFTHPVTWDDQISMHVCIEKVGTRSISFVVKGYILNDVLAFSATLTKVTACASTKSSIDIPSHIKQQLMAFL